MAGPEQSRSRAKAWAAEIDAARRRAGLMLPAGLTDRAAWLRRLLSEWALAEVAPGRLLPWLAVAFGFGIVGYFTADREPESWAAAALALVSGDDQAAAILGGDGRLAVLNSNRDRFAIKEWLAADADARTVKDARLHGGVQCDAAGCIGRLADGRLVSEILSVDAFAEYCVRAAVVVSPREAPSACNALLIDRKIWRENGALALRLDRRPI